mmetsp:Transcript_74481/g.147503  ORF Transcript_74481/g.147503 Transcript_74481/m.147503 type:complete len:426 (+) Transcript_74481:27-1304(+)
MEGSLPVQLSTRVFWQGSPRCPPLLLAQYPAWLLGNVPTYGYGFVEAAKFGLAASLLGWWQRGRCAARNARGPCRNSIRNTWAVPLPESDRSMACLIIGLDGVLCNDAVEAAAAAVEAAMRLWSVAMAPVWDIDIGEAGIRRSWGFLEEQTTGSNNNAAPEWLLQKMRMLRCACDAEWELVLLARLCVEEALACRANRAKGRGGARPLTVGEIEASWVDDGFGLRDSLLRRWGSSRNDVEAAMAEARWRRFNGLGSPTEPYDKRFHVDVVRAVHAVVACGAAAETVYVITSREQRSAVKVLQEASSAARKERGSATLDYQGTWAGKDGWRLVCGLGSIEDKANAVQAICDEHGAAGARVHLVDDSVSLLKLCASRLALGRVSLHLASWGHVSLSHWTQERDHLPRVQEFSGSDEFRRFFLGGTRA